MIFNKNILRSSHRFLCYESKKMKSLTLLSTLLVLLCISGQSFASGWTNEQLAELFRNHPTIRKEMISKVRSGYNITFNFIPLAQNCDAVSCTSDLLAIMTASSGSNKTSIVGVVRQSSNESSEPELFFVEFRKMTGVKSSINPYYSPVN